MPGIYAGTDFGASGPNSIVAEIIRVFRTVLKEILLKSQRAYHCAEVYGI